MKSFSKNENSVQNPVQAQIMSNSSLELSEKFTVKPANEFIALLGFIRPCLMYSSRSEFNVGEYLMVVIILR